MHVASHFSSYVDFRSASAFVFFKLNVRPGNLNSWISHCTQIIHECQYELNEMQGLTLARCTGSLQLCLRLGCSMYKPMLPLAWMCRPCAPCIPLYIFDTANGWSNKRNRPWCCTGGQILTRLYGCAGCVPDPVAPSCFAKKWICLFQMISPEEIRVKVRVA